MSLTLPAIFTNKYPTSFYLSLSRTHFSQSPNIAFSPLNYKTNFAKYRFFVPYNCLLSLTKINAAFEEPYGNANELRNTTGATFDGSNFDAFLSIFEFLSLASSAAISIYVAVSSGLQEKAVLKWVGSKILVWQCVVLVSGIAVGAVIRRRQWRMISGARVSSGLGSIGINLVERVRKLEEDLRSLASITRVLSRQLEKLGNRFRLTRKALKEPIAQTAALVQKNSEATRALAAQEDILEKEIGELQKVLLAMQEQQQKQLELILAIGHAGKLFESKRANIRDENAASKASKESLDRVPNSEINQVEAVMLQKEADYDKA